MVLLLRSGMKRGLMSRVAAFQKSFKDLPGIWPRRGGRCWQPPSPDMERSKRQPDAAQSHELRTKHANPRRMNRMQQLKVKTGLELLSKGSGAPTPFHRQ